MKELSQIVGFIDENRPRKIEVLGNEDAISRHAELYKLLQEGTITTDEEAAAYFYGDAKAMNKTAYRQFKSKFRERLINTLFFIDMNTEAGDLQNATVAIQKEWAAINILYTKGKGLFATKLAEDLLPYAIKYESTEIVVYIIDRLRQNYGTQIDNRSRYDELKILQDKYMAMWQLEILARDIFHDIRMDYIKSIVTQPDSVEKAQRGWAILQPYLEKNKSYQFLANAYCVKIAQYPSTTENLPTIIAVCDEAIAELSNKPYHAKRLIPIFMNPKIACYAQLKQQEEGDKVAKEVLALQEEGSLGWFKSLQNQTFLAFYTQNYNTAFQNWLTVQKHKSFKTLNLFHYEIWQLFGAYLHFLVLSGKIDVQAMAEFKYKNSKFINDVPTFSADKEGMNVPVLIAQIAILIAEKKFQVIPDRLEALAKYWRRHVRKTDEAYRSHCFIKMLQELPKANYKRIGIEARTKTMLAYLTAVPVNIETINIKSEIMPLEDLWAILLSLM